MSSRWSGRARARRSIAGPQRLEGRVRARPGRRPASRARPRPAAFAVARALRISVDERDELADLGARRRGRARPRPGQRATISSSGSVARCGMAAHSASVTNGMTGWSRRRYVSSTSTSVHQVASRAAGSSDSSAEPDLGELEAPVAELVPDGVVQDAGHLAEGVVGDGLVDGRRGRRGPRQQPALGRSEVRGRRAARRSASLGDGRRPGPDHEPRRVPELVGEVAGVLELGRPEPLVVAGRRAVDEREPQRVGPGLVDRPRAGRRRCPSSSTSSGRSGSRMSPDR